MADPHTLEVLNEVRNAANAVERLADTLLGQHREGGLEPAGSAGYVRRLRDRAAVKLWATDDLVVDSADRLMVALGYTPPGEPVREEEIQALRNLLRRSRQALRGLKAHAHSTVESGIDGLLLEIAAAIPKETP